MKRTRTILSLSLFVFLLVACNTIGDQGSIHIRLVADGRERAYTQSQAISVGQFLQKENIVLGEFDKVYPATFTPLTDNMTVTIIRVTEKEDCQEQDIPYETVTQKRDDLPAGDKKVIQAGVNGRKRDCAKITLEDGVEKGRLPGSSTVISQPTTEIVAIGVDSKSIEPVLINGLIVYMSGGQARAIEGNSSTQRTLPTNGNLDGRVFALSPTSRQLLYTRTAGDAGKSAPSGSINELWILLDTADPTSKPVKLLDDVLSADWVPDRPNTFSYSTGRWADKFPGYEAFNDLIVAQVDPKVGKLLKAQKLITAGPTGLYSFWGTRFQWSPDGKSLAWAQADGIGTADTKTGKLTKLFDFKVYSTTLPRGWVWVPSLSWAPSGGILAATVHGLPESGEPPDTSPIFDLALKPDKGSWQVTLSSKIGMWARPQFGPLRDAQTGDSALAYLRARDGINSLNSEYDLMIADRDGSNAELIFPGTDRIGLKPVDDFSSDLIWGPDGRQILIVYQGNIWMIDSISHRANQLTVVDNARLPRWVK